MNDENPWKAYYAHCDLEDAAHDEWVREEEIGRKFMVKAQIIGLLTMTAALMWNYTGLGGREYVTMAVCLGISASIVLVDISFIHNRRSNRAFKNMMRLFDEGSKI